MTLFLNEVGYVGTRGLEELGLIYDFVWNIVNFRSLF